MGRCLAVAVALVVTALPTPAAAAVTPPPGFVDTGAGGVPTSDGARWLEIPRPNGTFELLDSAIGTWRTVDRPADCGISGIGARQAVLTCAGDPDGEAPLTWDLATGVYTESPPIAAHMERKDDVSAAGVSAYYTDVGRYWIRATTSTYHDAMWDDLYSRADAHELSTDEISATRRPDPDARSGSVPLCRPLRRRIGPQGFDRWPKYARYHFERPYGLSTGRRGGLVLDRCGSRSRRLSSNREVYSEQLGARYVTWAEPPDRVHLYDIRRRRRHVWSFTGASAGYLAVAHTRTHIAVHDFAAYPPDNRVYLTRIDTDARR